jgi:hypothetical protein
MTNYQTLLKRIKAAKNKRELLRIDQSATRVYDAGQLTQSEFSRVCVKVMEKIAVITT